MDEFETFYGELVLTNGSLRITVPKRLVDFAGYKAGDNVKVMIRKSDIVEDKEE